MSSNILSTTSESLFNATFLSFFQNLSRTHQGTVIRNFSISVTTSNGKQDMPMVKVIIKLKHENGETATNLIGHGLDGIQYLIDEEIWDVIGCSKPSDNWTYRLIITISIDDDNKYRIINTRLYKDYDRPLTSEPQPPRERFINTKSIIEQLQLERTRREESLNLPITTQRRQTSVETDDSEWDDIARELLLHHEENQSRHDSWKPSPSVITTHSDNN
jgi:hypothetical protein